MWKRNRNGGWIMVPNKRAVYVRLEPGEYDMLLKLQKLAEKRTGKIYSMAHLFKILLKNYKFEDMKFEL